MSGPRKKTVTERPSPRSLACEEPKPLLIVAGSADHPGGSADPALPSQRLLPVCPAGLRIRRRDAVRADAADGAWLVDDRLVSGKHATVAAAGDRFEIVDHDSRNGTFVDGARVRGSAPVYDGAVIFVGGHAAVFRMVTASAQKAIEEELAEGLAPVPTVSPALAVICRRLRRLAASEADLLLLGESGTGKEIYARALHEASGRPGLFVAVNCAAIPRELMESELFGYVRGAHSLARGAKPGLVEEAAGGTVFLDEIGDMPPEMQAKLLRFVQDRVLTPLGSTRPRRIDARIVGATNRPVMDADGAGAGVRADLAARLGAEPIRLPPLRDRLEDVGSLVAHFLGNRRRRLDAAAFRALFLHGWIGNVRELGKTIETALTMTGGGAAPIRLEHLPSGIGRGVATAAPAQPSGPIRLPPTRDDMIVLLRDNDGSVRGVARAVGRDRTQVYRWIKKLKIDPEQYRD